MLVDRMKKDGTFLTLSKKERLQVDRMRAKLEKNLGSISDMTRLPGALFVVDIKREHIAIKEAQKLNIPIFAMVDTNSDPREVDYVIPANDDASKSIDKILSVVSEAVIEGLSERKKGKEQEEKAAQKTEEATAEKAEAKAEAPVVAKEEVAPAKEAAPVEEAPKEEAKEEAKAAPTKKATTKKAAAKKPAAKKTAAKKKKEDTPEGDA